MVGRDVEEVEVVARGFYFGPEDGLEAEQPHDLADLGDHLRDGVRGAGGWPPARERGVHRLAGEALLQVRRGEVTVLRVVGGGQRLLQRVGGAAGAGTLFRWQATDAAEKGRQLPFSAEVASFPGFGAGHVVHARQLGQRLLPHFVQLVVDRHRLDPHRKTYKNPSPGTRGLHAVPPCFAGGPARSTTAGGMRCGRPDNGGPPGATTGARARSPPGSGGNFTGAPPRRLPVGGLPSLVGATPGTRLRRRHWRSQLFAASIPRR